MSEGRQVKSKSRVREHGEVFTAEREVKAMCDLVKDETERIDSKILEPACGDGNFLAEILARKLASVHRKYHDDCSGYEREAVIAASSIYGIDILLDNVVACRERLYRIWDKEYTKNCGNKADDETRDAVRYILSRNIVCGNALTTYCVDENQNDTDEPIVFSEWTFVSGDQIQRIDNTLAKLMREGENEDQITLGDILNDENDFLKKYTTSYRKVQYNG